MGTSRLLSPSTEEFIQSLQSLKKQQLKSNIHFPSHTYTLGWIILLKTKLLFS